MTTFNPHLSFGQNHPAEAARLSSGAVWTGRVLSTIISLLLGFDATVKLLRIAPVMKASEQLGYSAHAVFGIGVVLAVCVALYVIPRSSILGALLLTGYLGGAIATHVRAGDPLFTHVLFPIYVAAIVWAGLLLRDSRLRTLVKSCFSR